MSASPGPAPASDGPGRGELADPTFTPGAYVLISGILRVGVVVAGVLFVVGLVGYLLAHPGASSSVGFHEAAIVWSLSPVPLAEGLARFDPNALMAAGVLVLIVVTVVRVVAAMGYFFRGHERALAVLTAAVAILLLLGLLVVGPVIAAVAGG